MNNYLRWNDALASRFFNHDVAGRGVHLYVNQKLISDMEKDLAPIAGKFLDAISEGPSWATRQGDCQRAFQSFENWRDRRLGYPPYVAYLALFVLAGGAEGDFATNDYHNRLRQVLGLDSHGFVPSFDRMGILWEDLETWSIRDKQGDLGIFQARHVGGHVHIGFPLAQTILTEQERHLLPKIFYDAGLDPTSNPPAEELARILRYCGAGVLQPRTMKLVTTKYDESMYAAMIATVADELTAWDGRVPDPVGSGTGPHLAFAGLRICLTIDSSAQKVSASLRCKLNREFPEDGIVLNVPRDPIRLLAEDYLSGWSTPLHNAVTGEAVDATHFNWTSGVLMKTESINWKVRLPGRELRVFIDGKTEGLSEQIEVQALPKGQPFFMAYSQSCWPDVEKWATTQCTGFRKHQILQGLPSGWEIAEVAGAISDEAIKARFPYMSFPATARIRLIGGIRSGRVTNYFSFAPPQVQIDGGTAGATVSCNGSPLAPNARTNVFSLPTGLPIETRLVVEAIFADGLVLHQSLFLTGDFSVAAPEQPLCLNRFGSVASSPDDKDSYIVGTIIQGTTIPDISPQELLEDLGVELSGSIALLIGRKPGQIAAWSEGSNALKWKPAWAISKRGRCGRAIFVGDKPSDFLPDPIADGAACDVRKWKDAVWYWRKRIAPPSPAPLRSLWKMYQGVARDV